jgi:single-strand DNA-binding protein
MPTPALDATNVVVLTGVLSGEPRDRSLPSGDRLVEFDVTTRGAAGVYNAPVAWFGPSGLADRLEAASPVVVVGLVRRRFFRAGGATQSRTEVLALRVADAARPSAVRRALADVSRALGA